MAQEVTDSCAETGKEFDLVRLQKNPPPQHKPAKNFVTSHNLNAEEEKRSSMNFQGKRKNDTDLKGVWSYLH